MVWKDTIGAYGRGKTVKNDFSPVCEYTFLVFGKINK